MSDIEAQVAALASPDEEGFVQEPIVDIFSTEESKQALLDYLAKELDEVSSDAGRSVRMTRNTTIKRQRLARPVSESKNFPWENASNVSPPLALQKTNQVVTRILNKLISKDPLIKYEANQAFKAQAEAITRYVQLLVESPYGIDFYSKIWDIVYDTVSLGTKFVKVPFTVERMRFKRKDAQGSETDVDRVIKASPDVIAIPMEDFLTRPHWTDIQKAPWIAVRYYKFKHELEALAAQGYYTNVDQIITETGALDIHKEDEMRLMGVEQSGGGTPENEIYEIFEANVFWDADGDGFAEDIIVTIEKNSKTILRAEFNDLGVRDYRRLPHINIPGSLYALGVGDIMIPLQEEAEALHNMRNDATQLAILPIVVTAEGSDFGARQELFPGKIIKTAVPREDIIINKFPNVGPDAMRAEQYVEHLADKATGANEGLSGGDVGGSNRIGAQGTQFLASQSLGYIDSIAQQMEKEIANMGMLFLYQLVKNSALVDLTMLTEADQILVKEVLSVNVEDIPGKFKFKARLSKMADSQATKQQEAIQLFQVYMAYGDKMGQLAASMANPQMAQVPRVVESMQTYFVGLTNIMNKVLENFDEDNVEDYLPFVKDLETALRMADNQRQTELDANEAGLRSAESGGAPQAPIQPELAGGGGVGNDEGNAPSPEPSNIQNVGGPGVVGGQSI